MAGNTVRVSIGMRREDVWAAATRDAGALLGIPQLGRIEPGAPADLLIFREDPIQRSDAVMTLEAVISRGRLYPSKTLLGQLLEHARYHDRWLVQTLRTLQARWLLWWNPASVLDCQLP
jgi:predicted amidohydrolase